MTSIRPFGPIDWLLGKLPQIPHWSVLGTIATEDRCLAAAQSVFHSHRASDITLLKILDPPSATNVFRNDVLAKLANLESSARAEFASVLNVTEMELLCLDQEVADMASICRRCPRGSSSRC